MPTNTPDTSNKSSASTEPQAQEPISSMRGLLVGVVFLLIVLGVLVFIGAGAGRKTGLEPPVPPLGPEAVGTLPRSLPIAAVSDEADKKVLREYFAKAAPGNFKEELLAVVPREAGAAYNKFAAATGEAKLEAARIFFVYLNNPAVDRSDPSAMGFLEDVKSDLEKAVGQPLF